MSRKRRKEKGRPAGPVQVPFPSTGGKPVLRPEIPFDEEMDLHGLAVDEALVQADLAIGRYRGRPGAVLRFIHGHSSGGSGLGSIKGALKRSLETVWKSRIQSFRPEPGNPGATLVKVG